MACTKHLFNRVLFQFRIKRHLCFANKNLFCSFFSRAPPFSRFAVADFFAVVVVVVVVIFVAFRHNSHNFNDARALNANTHSNVFASLKHIYFKFIVSEPCMCVCACVCLGKTEATRIYFICIHNEAPMHAQRFVIVVVATLVIIIRLCRSFFRFSRQTRYVNRWMCAYLFKIFDGKMHILRYKANSIKRFPFHAKYSFSRIKQCTMRNERIGRWLVQRILIIPV